MRIATGQLFQETNAFCPSPTTLDTFRSVCFSHGEDLLTAYADARVEIPAFLDVLRAAGATPVPLVAANALALHGAMCIEDEPVSESEVIERVSVCRKPGTPIGVSLDLHGHFTARMLRPDVFFVGYRDYPQIDVYETGQRTAGEILRAPFFPAQPWLDIPGLSFGVLMCANADQAAARRGADELADLAWNCRHEFDPELVDLDTAIRIGVAGRGTTVVADSGDAPCGSSAADNTSVLAAALATGVEKGNRLKCLTICDADAARQCAVAGVGVGQTLGLSPVRKVSRLGDTIPVTCRIVSLSDGSFVMRDAGARVEFGLTAVVAVGSIRIAVRSLPAYEWDNGTYTAFGLRLEEVTLVFVKSPSHFRVAFAPCAEGVLLADMPGPTCPNMRRLHLRRVTRPLFPLDDDAPPNGLPSGSPAH